jgi:hypothetical protein
MKFDFISLTIKILFLVLSFSSAHAEVWYHQPKEVWTEEWENRYSKWVETNVGTDWLQKVGFVGLKTDCAKFPYLVRLYFSYINGLEFAIHGNSKKISSRDETWNSYSAGPLRLKAFARYISQHVDTSTLPRDTVLVALNSKFIKPGIVLAADHKRTHTWLVKKINPSGIPVLIYGTLPGSDFLYRSYVFPPAESTFPLGQLPSNADGGFRRFRWPQDLYQSIQKISYASPEQSDSQAIKLSTFFSDLQNQLRLAPKDTSEEFGYMMDDLCMKMRERVNIVIDSGHALRANGHKKFSAEEDNLYSTPKRDGDIMLLIENLDSFYQRHLSEVSRTNERRYNSILNPAWTMADECLVSWADNRLEPLGELRRRFRLGLMSSDSAAPFASRWGDQGR